MTALNLPLGIKNVCVHCTDVHLLSKYNSMAMGLEKGTQLQQQRVALSKPLTFPRSWLRPLDMGEWETLISLFPLDSPLTYQLLLLVSPRSTQERRRSNLKKSTEYYCRKWCHALWD